MLKGLFKAYQPFDRTYVVEVGKQRLRFCGFSRTVRKLFSKVFMGISVCKERTDLRDLRGHCHGH
jgi:hypothetical protein